MVDVVVIGGGPAGLLAAREAAKKGAEVILFEKDLEIGEPERCAGLLSLTGLEKLSVDGSREYIQNRIRGAVFHAESGRKCLLDAKKAIAAVVSRKLFDQKLAESCEKLGVKVLTNTRVKRVLGCAPFEIHTTAGTFNSSWIIDAEGAGSTLLRRTIGKAPESSGWMPILQFTIERHNLPREYVHLYFTRMFPDFFAYFIPSDEECGKVGAASRKIDLRQSLEKFLSKEFPGARILRRISHTIYTGKPLKDLDFSFSRRFVPVGDAAGHVKATTGGGVIMGGLISMNVASAIGECLRDGDPKPYLEKARKVLKELDRIYSFRRLLYSGPRGLRERLIAIATSKPMLSYLAKFGDMDFQLSALLGKGLSRI